MSETISTTDRSDLFPQVQIELSNRDQSEGRPDEIHAERGAQHDNEAAGRAIATQALSQTRLDPFEAARLRFFT
jgi:hypothetical protein